MLSLLAAPASAALVDPQVAEVGSIKEASLIPPTMRFENGFPRTGQLRLPVVGSSAIERAVNFVHSYPALFRIDNADQSLHQAEVGHWFGGERVTLSQRYKGLPIFGARLNIFLGNGGPGSASTVEAFNGALLPSLGNLDVIPAITAAMAEDAARTALGAPTASVVGQTGLMIYDPLLLGDESDPHLVYRVTLLAPKPIQMLVDANGGGEVLRHPLERDSSGLDMAFLDFEDANGLTLADTNCFTSTTLEEHYGDAWGMDSAYQSDSDAVSAWIAGRETYLFFHDTYDLHSWDGAHAEAGFYVHAGFVQNATYSSFCDASQYSNSYATRDVVTHEFTHGVIAHSSNLLYVNESGALNESYADTFTAVADPNGGEWLIGEDVTDSSGPLRSMSNPPLFSQPDVYSNWVTRPPTEDGDYGGVHTNSGIANKASYLMATGAAHNGRPAFPGMGMQKMGRIQFATMRSLSILSDFEDARDTAVSWATAMATFQIGGITSADVCAVRNAYAAVEIGFGDLDCNGVEDNAQDQDGDLKSDAVDNCPTVPNPGQYDCDGNGVGNACEPEGDSDNDGLPDSCDNCPNQINIFQLDSDGDGIGDACETDSDDDGIDNLIDNCRFAPNPDQADSDGNGIGDACDSDPDSDGFGFGDNCPWVPNDQTDSDGDQIGDACDKCPNTNEPGLAWTPGIPEFGVPPEPIQPDSDGDGVPDACDPLAYDGIGVTSGGDLYSYVNPVSPDSISRGILLTAPPGPHPPINLPLDVCTEDVPPYGTSDLYELQLLRASRGLSFSVRDESGIYVAHSRPSNLSALIEGLRFRPDCSHTYTLEMRFGDDYFGNGGVGVTGIVASTDVPTPYTDEPNPLWAPPTVPALGLAMRGFVTAVVGALGFGWAARARFRMRSRRERADRQLEN